MRLFKLGLLLGLATPVLLADFDPAAIAKKALPAVVTIRARSAAGDSSASGFIVDPSGTIITNLHVIRGATSAAVRTANGDIYEEVRIKAFDERKDLAVIQIPAFGLPTLALGNSEEIKPGERVLVIGNALGVLEGTISAGVVSGFRNFDGYKVLQTDASANHGNSGGPMLNESAQVIGVVTFKVGEGIAENLNFAVPINYARGMLSSVEALTFADLSARLGKTRDLFTDKVSSLPKRWKSLNSGTVKIIRADGDYLYMETELPNEAKQAGDFQLTEFKKVGDRYAGISRWRITCSYGGGLTAVRINQCSGEEPMEITLFTPTRIEGRTPARPGAQFKCGECKYDPPRANWPMVPFTWIPE